MAPNAPARPAAHRHAGRVAPSLTGAALRAATAAALVIDGVVHVRDAYFYDANTGPLLSQGQLFRIQGVVAFVVAAALVLLPAGRGRWRVLWVVAFAVAASALGAVLLYSYVNVGPLAGLPNMYEPSWGPPGKAVSAVAEGAGALLALAGLAWAVRRGRQR
jgi:hypothetical protein